MATIALIDVSPATAALVEAAGAADAIVRATAADIPADAALLISEDGADLARLSASGRPVLLLCRRGNVADARDGAFTVLENPCDLLVLRGQIRAMLETSGAAEPNPWLSPPLLTPAAAESLRFAKHLASPLWLVGEPGTGIDFVAAAVSRVWGAGQRPVVWDEDDRLLPLPDGEQALWVPSLDERPVADQRALERLLAMEPRHRIVVTTGDRTDASSANRADALGPTLLALLSRNAVRLAPLRERTGDILCLATLFAGRAATAAGLATCRFTADAERLLQTYPWPGNVVELDSVVTRTVLAHGGGDIDARDLQFVPAFGRATAEASAMAPEPTPAADRDEPASARRAVVVPLGATPRPAKLDSTSEDTAQPAARPTQSPATSSGVESVLAAFAHDLRNPMATIKTFASLQTDGGELAQLAADACERVDEHLRLLQRYTEVVSAAWDRPADARVDLVEILADAIETVGADDALQIAARGSVEARCDEAMARFIADAIVAECAARSDRDATGGPATADISASRTAVTLRIPTGTAAIERLGKWVGAKGEPREPETGSDDLPWRLAIARDAARRSGGDVTLEAAEGDLILEWSMSRGAEAAEAAPLRSASSRTRAASPRPKANS